MVDLIEIITRIIFKLICFSLSKVKGIVIVFSFCVPGVGIEADENGGQEATRGLASTACKVLYQCESGDAAGNMLALVLNAINIVLARLKTSDKMSVSASPKSKVPRSVI